MTLEGRMTGEETNQLRKPPPQIPADNLGVDWLFLFPVLIVIADSHSTVRQFRSH